MCLCRPLLQLVTEYFVSLLQSNAEINVKIESTGSDTKVNISSSTTAGDVVEMLARSPQQRFLFILN